MIEEIMKNLDLMFPDARCELIYHNSYELLVAIMLSAQTTDKAVNKVTPALFLEFPSIEALAQADYSSIENCIRSLGLFRNKAKNLKLMAHDVITHYNGEIPKDFNLLTSLPGVGRKTANVFLAEFYQIPRVPVDTHVERVTKRLGIVSKEASVFETEKKIMEVFPMDKWIKLHHQFIFLGRYVCKALNPNCCLCRLANICQKGDKNV